MSAHRLQRYQEALEAEAEKFSKLTAEHIKSVNSVGTGLEPITDEEFKQKFQKLHDQVGQWCRKAFRQKELRPFEELDKYVQNVLQHRAQEDCGIKFAQMAEIILWTFFEDIFLAWFPGFPKEVVSHIKGLNDHILCGDRSNNKDRSEFWRAYTASMLFQMDSTTIMLNSCEEDAQIILRLLTTMPTTPLDIDDDSYLAFVDILRNVRRLAAELRCQRSIYEVEQDIHVHQPYDDATMTDVQFSAGLDDDEEVEKRQAVITAVIAKGIVKRPYPGSKEVYAVISKPRVKIAFTNV
ncbi:Protein of unknown function [Pyronema omphalodes CBS 100304]|uniref:Uncharacterized protein n=1 Tax=Pyronema omphalodes (strain CBS 100304) TaxID=1076935 RepID=U4LBL3_PYROM|nr:Protein of unknown function [Pyronema omphalodes CBS 100304]